MTAARETLIHLGKLKLSNKLFHMRVPLKGGEGRQERVENFPPSLNMKSELKRKAQ